MIDVRLEYSHRSFQLAEQRRCVLAIARRGPKANGEALNLTGSDIARRPAQRMRRRAEGDNIMARRAFADLRQRRCYVSASRDQQLTHAHVAERLLEGGEPHGIKPI